MIPFGIGLNRVFQLGASDWDELRFTREPGASFLEGLRNEHGNMWEPNNACNTPGSKTGNG